MGKSKKVKFAKKTKTNRKSKASKKGILKNVTPFVKKTGKRVEKMTKEIVDEPLNLGAEMIVKGGKRKLTKKKGGKRKPQPWMKMQSDLVKKIAAKEKIKYPQAMKRLKFHMTKALGNPYQKGGPLSYSDALKKTMATI